MKYTITITYLDGTIAKQESYSLYDSYEISLDTRRIAQKIIITTDSSDESLT